MLLPNIVTVIRIYDRITYNVPYFFADILTKTKVCEFFEDLLHHRYFKSKGDFYL